MSCKSENKTETTPNNAVGFFQNPIKTSYDLEGHPNPTKNRVRYYESNHS